MKITTEEYISLKRKAEKWDELGKQIAKFYVPENWDGESDLEDYDGGGDLGDIGEVAASAFGWL